jgi:hypothetical protein
VSQALLMTKLARGFLSRLRRKRTLEHIDAARAKGLRYNDKQVAKILKLQGMMRDSISRRRAAVNWHQGLARAIVLNNVQDVITGIREGSILADLKVPLRITVGARQNQNAPLLSGEVKALAPPQRAHPINVSRTSQGGTAGSLELVFPALVGCQEAAVTRQGLVPHVREAIPSCDLAAAEEVRKVLLRALPLSSANLQLAPATFSFCQNRQVLDRARLVDLCARVYRQHGRPFFDPACGTTVYTEIYLEKPSVQPDGSVRHPSTFFEVAEWNPLNPTHRLLLRNALVAHLQLSRLRETVGHFWTHPLRNAFLVKQDGKRDPATSKSLRSKGDRKVSIVNTE